jgi:preprotein translocase subunit SecE
MKAGKVPQKKLEQETKVQAIKEAKEPKTPTGGPKRSKPKTVESGRKKAPKKASPFNVLTDWWMRCVQYLREVVHELRKVVFPSRKETIGSTSVVLVIVLLASLFLGLVDSVLSRLVRLLVG